ncbi:MAG: cytochrome c [Verrucomicrobia bacterium]|nr:cytochrome c [Verrucomicrobiota bacterium]
MNSNRKNSSQPQNSSKPSAGNSGRQPLVETEPVAARAQSPIWLAVLFGVLLYWAQLYLDNYAGGFDPHVYAPFRSYQQVAAANPKSGAEMLIAKGEVFYQNCLGCHQANGMGTPGQTPPLAGSEWVLEPNPARLIRIVLQAPTGPFKVKDVEWNTSQAMVPFGSFPDEDIAAVLSYVRQNQQWGNNAPPVTPEQVKAVRDETSSRSAPWTMDELLKVPITP